MNIPLNVVYAGLAGTLLALLVATWQQKCRAKVFFLLALRLAIGWHFAFEGMYKIHSHLVGPTETNRPFSSEPYFKVAPGPFGAYMRKSAGLEPTDTIAAYLGRASEAKRPDFLKLSAAEQVAMCPEAVAKQLDDVSAKAETPKELLEAAKVKYARWVCGVDRRDGKVKAISSDVPMSGPERLAQVGILGAEIRSHEERNGAGLGNGYGIEIKRLAELRADLLAANADLAKDAEAFVAELKKDVAGGKKIDEDAAPKPMESMDKLTMWFIAAVGCCVFFGLFTRPACVLAAGFLVLTYLTHPPFPWYPLPPNTEGNPLFVNKNVIEALALLSLACMPTGRWLGVDAILGWAYRRVRG